MKLFKNNLKPGDDLREEDSDYYCDGPSQQFYWGLERELIFNNE